VVTSFLVRATAFGDHPAQEGNRSFRLIRLVVQDREEQETWRELGAARKKLVEQILRFRVGITGMTHPSLKIE
jgi:hypothetical protein